MFFSGLTVTFLKQFFYGLWLMLPVLVSLAVIVSLLGYYVGKIEKWPRYDGIYWAFITATTVGYGDIRPVEKKSRFVAVMIGFLGLTLTGIIVAVAVQAATLAIGSQRI